MVDTLQVYLPFLFPSLFFLLKLSFIIILYSLIVSKIPHKKRADSFLSALTAYNFVMIYYVLVYKPILYKTSFCTVFALTSLCISELFFNLNTII